MMYSRSRIVGRMTGRGCLTNHFSPLQIQTRAFTSNALLFKSSQSEDEKFNSAEKLRETLSPSSKAESEVKELHELSREYMNPNMSPERMKEIERKAKSLNSTDSDRIHAFFARLRGDNKESLKEEHVDLDADIPVVRYEDKLDETLPSFVRELRNEIEKDQQFYHRYEIIFLESEDDYNPNYVTYDYDKSADVNRIGHDPNSFGLTDEDPAVVHWLDQISAPAKDKLAMRQKKYKRIMRAFSVADYRDNPAYVASSGSCWIWIEENSPQDKLLVQLGNHVPPCMWIPLKPKKEAIKKLFDEVTAMEAGGAGRIMESTDEMLSKINFDSKEVEVKEKQENLINYINNFNPDKLEDFFPNSFSMFLGNTNDMRTIEESFMNNPYTFNTPVILGSSNRHSRGRPVVVSKFRTTLTRSIITLVARYDFQLHLAANDEDSTWNMPIFAYVNYPDNSYISRPIPQRINKLFDVDFPENTPLDVIGALLPYKMRTWRSVREYISGMKSYDVPPQIIGHLAMLGDPNLDEIIETYRTAEDPVYRLACVIAACQAGKKDLAQSIMEVENRMEVQDLMKTYVDRTS